MTGWNPTDIFDLPKRDAGTLALAWDPAAERFVRLTVSATGRILARADLEPIERRAVLRCLMATRTQVDEQRSFALLLQRLKLVAGSKIVLPPGERGPVVEILSRRFSPGFTMPDVEAFAEYMEIGIRTLLILAWSVSLVRAVPGQCLARLENLDPDLPYMPPMGLGPPAVGFDAARVLVEIEGEEPDDGEPPFGLGRTFR